MSSRLTYLICLTIVAGAMACTADAPAPAYVPNHYSRGLELAHSSINDALTHAQAHINLAQQQGNEREQIRGQQLVAYINQTNQQYMEAFTAMAEAYSLAAEFGTDEFTVYQFLVMGNAALDLGVSQAAIVYYQRAVNLYEATKRRGDKPYAGKALMYWARCLNDTDANAKRLYQRALKLVTSPRVKAEVYIYLARFSIFEADFDKAEVLIQRAAQTDNSARTQYMVGYETAWLLRFRGKFESAIATFNNVLANDNNYTPMQQFKLYKSLGECYEANGQTKQAVEQYLKAWDVTHNKPLRKLQLAKLLFPIMNGHPRQAEIAQRKTDMEVKQAQAMDAIKTEATTQVLHQKFFQAEARALQAKAQSTQLTYYLIGFAVLLTILIAIAITIARYRIKLAIQNTEAKETAAMRDIIRDLLTLFKQNNKNK